MPEINPQEVVPEAEATVSREQAVLCPVLGSMIAQGDVPLDAKGQLKLADLHRFLVEGMNVSEPLAGLTLGLGPLGNPLRDVLGNVLGRHFNPLELRGGLAQHPGDSAILTAGQFDEQKFQALVAHSRDGVAMTVADLAEAIVANVRRDGTPKAYTKGMPTALFEFGALINIVGTRGPDGRRRIAISTMRDLYQHKRLPPLSELKARPASTIAELSETMAQMAANLPLRGPLAEVNAAISSALSLGRPQRNVVRDPPAAPFAPPQSVREVLRDLEAVVDHALVAPNRIGYFASLYGSVTNSIRRAIVARAYDDNARLERLDVIFATRFLEAWDTYRRGGAPTGSYKLAFDALTSPNLLVVQHQLLALNAHILLDLGIAAATVAPGPELPSLKADFFRVNDILLRFIGLIQVKVGQVSPLIKRLEDLGMNWEARVIGFSLKEARDAAWRFAERLAAAPQADWPALIAAQDAETVRLGHLILRPGEPAQLVLDVISAAESKDVPLNIRIVGE